MGPGCRRSRPPQMTGVAMLDWFQRLMPHTELFFPLFERHATTVTAAAEALRQLLDGGEQAAARGKDILRLEEEADAITREILIGVRSTFITPFDRGDIKALITSMDDAIDEMQKTVKAISLFELTSFEPDMRAMADVGQLHEICVQVNRIEGQGDDIHDRGLRGIYEKSKTGDAMAFVRSKEIYDLLEQVIDSFDDVCDQIQGVIIEHA